jgi:hypothetical protein
MSCLSLWVPHHEDLLRKWSETCKTMAVLHTRSSSYYAAWDRRLGIPMVVLGAVVASSIFISTNDPSGLLTYINGALALVITALTGIGRFLNLAELRVGHTSASNKYTAIAMNMDSALSFPRIERIDGPQVMIDSTRRAIGEIREHAPAIAPWLLNESLEKFNKSPLTRIRSVVNSSPGDPARSPPTDSTHRRMTSRDPSSSSPPSPNNIIVTGDTAEDTPDADFCQQAVAITVAIRSDSDEDVL